MATADLAIIGSGIIGNGIAYQLAMRGVTNILMLEREVVAHGSSGRTTGDIRQQFAHSRMEHGDLALLA